MDLVHVEDLLPAEPGLWQPGDAFLAGGTWLFSEPQPTVRRLLDLAAFGWPAITALPDGGVEIAATCTIAELNAWRSAPRLVQQCCDALLGSFKVWNAATVGGNICLALPAGPMTSLTAALDATAIVWTPDGGVRELPVVELVLGQRRTALAPGELLRAVRIGAEELYARAAFRQLSLSRYGRSAALVIGRAAADGSVVVTVTASVARPVRVEIRRGTSGEQAAAAVAAAVVDGPGWFADVHGAPDWRAAMTARLVAEVVDELTAPAIDAPS